MDISDYDLKNRIIYIRTCFTGSFDREYISISDENFFSFIYIQIKVLADKLSEFLKEVELPRLSGGTISYEEFMTECEDIGYDFTWILHYSSEIDKILTNKNLGCFTIALGLTLEDLFQKYIDRQKLSEATREKLSKLDSLEFEIIDEINDYWD